MRGSETSTEDAGMQAAADGPLVRLRGLTKSFQEGDRLRVVLDGLDADVRAEELVVLVGRSGSGKSTLLNLISGIDRPTGGTVTVDGVELTGLSEKERTLFRRHRIGFVFQSFNLIPTLTVLENLLLPMELRGARDDDRARGLLDRVGLLDRADSFPDRLSGGERQRVAAARALAHDPLLLLADEPTGNLDVETGSGVMDLLESLVREQGKTMIVATHDRDLLSRADRVMRLSGGVLQRDAEE
ncbi:MAG: ABC transporter ATP-binding protein [Rhodothermales bacterium]